MRLVREIIDSGTIYDATVQINGSNVDAIALGIRVMPQTTEKMKVLILADAASEGFVSWLGKELDEARFDSEPKWITQTGVDKALVNQVQSQYHAIVLVLSQKSGRNLQRDPNANLERLRMLEREGMKIVAVYIDSYTDNTFSKLEKFEIPWMANPDRKTLSRFRTLAEEIKDYLMEGWVPAVKPEIEPEVEQPPRKPVRKTRQPQKVARKMGKPILKQEVEQQPTKLSTQGKTKQLRDDHHWDSWILCVTFSPNGKYLASASHDKTARIWDVASGAEISRIKHHECVRSVSFSHDSKFLASASDDGIIRICDAKTGEEARIISNYDLAFSIDFSSDGKSLAIACSDETVYVWDVWSGVETLRIPLSARINHLKFSPNGEFLALASDDSSAKIWDTFNNSLFRQFNTQAGVYSVDFSKDGEYLAGGDDVGNVNVWRVAAGGLWQSFTHSDWVYSVAFSPDRKYLASASGDKTVRLWDLAKGEEAYVFDHPTIVHTVDFSPDGKYVASATSDDIVRRWDVFKGTVEKSYQHESTKKTKGATKRSATAARQSQVGTKNYFGSDLPAAVDSLGFTPFVGAFADLISAPLTGTPLTIGIYGNWGSGKSTLMNLLSKELKTRSRAEPLFHRHFRYFFPADNRHIWITNFNAWKFSSCKAVWPALVKDVMKTISGRFGWGIHLFWARFVRYLGKSIKSPKSLLSIYMFWAIGAALVWYPAQVAEFGKLIPLGKYLEEVLTIGVSSWAGFSFIKTAINAGASPFGGWFSKMFEGAPYGGNIEYMEDINSDLKFLGGRLAASNSRVLVLVDDLDRCEPDKAVEMLQAIKLLLDFEGVVVILGIDARVITAAVDNFYVKVFEKAGISGYEYLEKIVQVPFRIPEASDNEIKLYMSKIMLDREKKKYPSTPIGEKFKKRIAAFGILLGSVESPAKDGDTQLESIPDPITSREEDGQAISDEPTAARFVPAESETKTVPPTPTPPKPEPVEMSFSDDEIAAFKEHSDFLDHNPRHIKRLLNIYLLVRVLAIRIAKPGVLDNHRQVVRWLVMCTQWPYISSKMITHFRSNPSNFKDSVDGETLLRRLFNAVETSISTEYKDDHKEKRKKYDETDATLDKLLDKEIDAPDWELVDTLWPITINFNPAVEMAGSLTKTTKLVDDTPLEEQE